MNINKLIQLLKSPVEEDALIGINYMVHQYTDEEIIGFFNMYGDYKQETGGRKPKYLSEHCFLRYEEYINYKSYYKGNLEFFVGRRVILTKFPYNTPNYSIEL